MLLIFVLLYLCRVLIFAHGMGKCVARYRDKCRGQVYACMLLACASLNIVLLSVTNNSMLSP